MRTEHGSLVLLSQISSGGVGERAHHCLGRDRTAAVPAAEAPERRWRPLGTLERDGDPPRQPSCSPCRLLSINLEAAWKRQTAAKGSSYWRQVARGAARATDGSRSQQLLAPYKQEVARSSRAPPISIDPVRNRNATFRGSESGVLKGCCGSFGGSARRPGGKLVRRLDRAPSRPASPEHLAASSPARPSRPSPL